MLKIWGRKNSSNVRKALWCAEELGLDYEAIDAGGAFGVVDTPQYRALNPNGRVPMIEDGDFVLWESNTIVRYLCAKTRRIFTRATCKPGPAPRSGWTGPPRPWPSRSRRCSGASCVPRRKNRTGTASTPGAKPVSMRSKPSTRHSPSSLTCPASDFGMGDIPLGCFAYAWFEMPIERPAMPHLEAWYQRLQQRPAYRKAVMTALT